MNPLRASVPAAAVLQFIGASGAVAQTTPQPESDRTLLHCDPGVAVKSVDDDSERGASNPTGATDCMIPLAPGRHVVSLEFLWEIDNWPHHFRASVPGSVTLEFDARAGRIY